MDLPGILRRRPDLCLIDELAHTNVPGTEHQKRHEDVDAVLDAGIDVWSTVNVQHVESLASQIAALTGDRLSETLPDRVLDDAYNIVLVDITPELLIERLEAGEIYPDESADIARRNFFRPERLQMLRGSSFSTSPRRLSQDAEPHSGSKRPATNSVADRVRARRSFPCKTTLPRGIRERAIRGENRVRASTPGAKAQRRAPVSPLPASGPSPGLLPLWQYLHRVPLSFDALHALRTRRQRE